MILPLRPNRSMYAGTDIPQRYTEAAGFGIWCRTPSPLKNWCCAELSGHRTRLLISGIHRNWRTGSAGALDQSATSFAGHFGLDEGVEMATVDEVVGCEWTNGA